MNTKEHLIESLRALCAREGGVEAVADEIDANAQNLQHIVLGQNKLPSGAPRGVGPNLQKKLDERYPGWSVAPASNPVPTLDAALRVVLDAIEAMPSARWVSVRAQLDQLVGRPEMRDDVAAELAGLLFAPAKQLAAAG